MTSSFRELDKKVYPKTNFEEWPEYHFQNLFLSLLVHIYMGFSVIKYKNHPYETGVTFCFGLFLYTTTQIHVFVALYTKNVGEEM